MNPVVLPRYAFVKAWEWGGYGKPHPVIGADDLWLDDTVKTVLRREVDGLLEKAGVAANGVLMPEFRRTLAVLARAERECYGWISRHGETGAAMVAAVGEETVRVVRDAKVVIVDHVPIGDPPDALVDVLPDVIGAAVGEVTIPAAQYSGRRSPVADEYEFEMETRSRRPDPAVRVHELLSAPRSGTHQLYSAGRDRTGQRRRGRPITVIDLLETGRVLTYVTQSPNSEPMLHCAAGTRRALTSLLATA
ncbi:ESX secretion-associated protein EspG [Amycolatopsis pigmentata]|uniref:ESX secretion-associated protein EspG n=1 Tax=Amycolatopsis pigmentata TaxID=450801 RepID=A0ABW5FNJ7_9PSEU